MLKTIVHDYPYIHLGLGLIGNTLFVIGSILFFDQFKSWHHFAVWLFVIGSSLMWVGAAGEALEKLGDAFRNRWHARR